MARKYGKAASKSVEKEVRRFKKGTAKSGKGGAKVKSREQAIAIGLSKARKKGVKVPTKTSSLKAKAKKATSKRTSARRKTTRKAA